MGCLLLLNNLQPAQAGLAMAETPQPEIDAYIEERMGALEIPGLAVAIVKGDQIAYVRGYGAADAAGRPVTPQTPFLIASLSKSFTALGIMQLAEEGKLDLDAPVHAYLPWFRVADPVASRQITIRHLLYQTSGFSELEGYQRNLERDSSDMALESSVRRLVGSKLKAPPGEKFEYSNTNYDILGLLIQTITGKSYETYIEESLFAPLGMRNSYTSLDAARLGEVSTGYSSFFGTSLEFDRYMPYSRAVVPSAGLFASAEDMAHYLYAHLNEGRSPEGASLLSSAGMAELHKPGVQIDEQVGYAMGWTAFPFPQAATANKSSESVPVGLSHGGQWANFRSLMVLIPEHELGVAVLMNRNDYRQGDSYDNVGWNTALLALGLEPSISPPNDNPILQDGRLIMAIVLLLLIASLVWSARILFKPADQGEAERPRWQVWMFLFVLPVIDLALAGYLLFVYLPQSTSSFPLMLRFEPDTGLMCIVLLVLTLGWGTVRTILASRKLYIPGKVTPSVA